MHKYWVTFLVVLNTAPPQQQMSSMGVNSPIRICDFPDVQAIAASIFQTLQLQGAIPPGVEAVVNVLAFQKLETLVMH